MFSFYILLALNPITKAQKASLPTTYGERTANIHALKASCPNLFALGQKPVRCLGGLYKLGKAAWDSDIQFTEPTLTRND